MHVVTHMGPSYLIHENNTYLSTETMQIEQDYWKELLKIRKNPDIIIETVSNFDVLISFDEWYFVTKILLTYCEKKLF